MKNAAGDVIRQYFEQKKKIKGYSLRALARDLKVSPTFISNIFNGKKKVPLSMLPELARLLDIDAEILSAVKSQVTGNVATDKAALSPTHRWQPTEKKKLSILRNWFYVAIMEITSCTDFDGSEEAISRRLGISKATVEVAIRELLSLGLLENQEGKLKKSASHLRMGSASTLEDIRSFHRQMLKKAEDELLKTEQSDFKRRLITGITITASPEKIALAKKMLSEALHDIANILTEEDGSEVYHLAGQLFPLTKGG